MPRSTSRPLLACLALALISPAAARAAVAARASVEELARTSDAVVRGRVEKRVSYAVRGRVLSEVQLRAIEVWRGDAPQVVHIGVPGGVAGGIGQRVDAAPAFDEGEEVVVFLSTVRGGHRVNGLAQGKFRVEAGVARPDLRDTSFARHAIRAGERAAEEMPVAELERRVKEAR